MLHAATGLVVLAIPLLSWSLFRQIVWYIAGGVVLIDVIRLRVPAIHAAASALVPVFRDGEDQRLSGAAWLWLGYGLAAAVPGPAAAAGILVAALADPAAAAVGTRFGAPRAKTWQGSAACMLVAIAVLSALALPVRAVVLGSVVGTAFERWPGPFDDNLLTPPGVAGVVALLT